jgi:hypothetical protein
MAPSGNAAKARKSTTTKAGNPRPVVPAIPLPYIKRQAAARAAAAAQAATGTSTPAPTTETPSPDAEKVNGHVSSPEPTEAPKLVVGDQLGTSGMESEESKTEEADGMFFDLWHASQLIPV